MDINLLTPEQVSIALGINTHTLAVWRSSGRYNLPYIKAGRLVRYRQSDVSAFIDRSTKTHDNSFTSTR